MSCFTLLPQFSSMYVRLVGWLVEDKFEGSSGPNILEGKAPRLSATSARKRRHARDPPASTAVRFHRPAILNIRAVEERLKAQKVAFVDPHSTLQVVKSRAVLGSGWPSSVAKGCGESFTVAIESHFNMNWIGVIKTRWGIWAFSSEHEWS